MVVDIDFWMAWNEQRPWRGMVQEFNRLRRGQIRVTYQTFLGLTSTEFFDELRQMFDDPGRNPIEVTGGDVIWPAAFADNGWVWHPCVNRELFGCPWLTELPGEQCFSCSLTRTRPSDADDRRQGVVDLGRGRWRDLAR